MKLEVKKVGKSTKMDKEGSEIVTYTCLLQGDDGVKKISIVIKSDSIATMEMVVPQQVGETRIVTFGLVPK